MMLRRPRVIAMWSPPRCRSTAFERMMSERGDLTVLHEPFNVLAVKGAFTVADRTCTDPISLLDAILDLGTRESVYFKDTTDSRCPELLADPRFVTAVRHTFIIRDPAAALASHYARNPRLSEEEAGFGNCWEIFDLVHRVTATAPVVVDADDLVTDPEAVVAAYAAATGLPHRPDALTWSAGERGEWQVYADWHRDAAASTHIHDRATSYPDTVDNNPRLAELHARQLPFHQRLRAHRILPPAGQAASKPRSSPRSGPRPAPQPSPPPEHRPERRPDCAKATS